MEIKRDDYYYNGEVDSKNLPHGKGELKTKISTYTGEFFHGVKHGFGKEIFASGKTYEGQFKNGYFFDISGTMIDENGTKVIGSFVNYLPNGICSVDSKDYKYTGEMRNGKKEGKGKYIAINKASVTGIWCNDEIVYGNINYTYGTEYKGEFINNFPDSNGTKAMLYYRYNKHFSPIETGKFKIKNSSYELEKIDYQKLNFEDIKEFGV